MSVAVSPDGSLEGIAVCRTEIATVDGLAGRALIRGYSLPELAAKRSYEQVAELVVTGSLPPLGAQTAFSRAMHEGVALTSDERAAAKSLSLGRSGADALTAAIVLAEDQTARDTEDPSLRIARVLGRIPGVVAAIAGVDEPASGSYATRALRALGAKRSDDAAVRALDVLLCLEAEHGLAASTFAARIAASSGANAGPALCAATATLSGVRHGGATAQAKALIEAASASGDVVAFVREKFQAKARLPGFGHRIYKVADPRVPPLREAMAKMGSMRALEVAEALATAAVPLFGAKGVHANIDLFGAALMTALEVDPSHYVAVFALGLSAGWLAHWREQRDNGRLIRPDSEYVGAAERLVT